MNLNELITVDTEILPNYLLIMFRRIADGKVIFFEKFEDSELNIQNIFKILNKYKIVSFNGNHFDSLILEAATAGFSNESIKRVADTLIVDRTQPWQLRKQLGLAALKYDHIDLIEVAPLQAGLKLYAGRMHVKRMMDMPLDPGTVIEESQIPSMRFYCEIDNENTGELARNLLTELTLREEMGEKYGIDLRSKSDAQLAEAVIKRELEVTHHIVAKRPKIEPGSTIRYRPPSNISFKTDQLKEVFNLYKSIPIVILENGNCEIDFNQENTSFLDQSDYNQYYRDHPRKKKVPFLKWLESQKKKKLKLKIGSTMYTLGIGGIHSCEKSISHYSDEKHIIRDYDVATFYPKIILNNRLSPSHIGEPFLQVYQSLIDKRINSKKLLKTLKKGSEEYKTHTTVNESGKIIINGTFGKLGSKWSCIYAPNLMSFVTITGQLTILMLIESLELAGISVISGNTDGIVVKIPKSKLSIAEEIIEDWQFNTDYELESTDYISLHSRDINNYIAVKPDEPESIEYSDKSYHIKGKGAYADQRDHYYFLRNNPSSDICAEAVKVFLKTGKPIEDSVAECTDITKFVSVRTVNGGAVKDGQYVGKVVRWYYGKDEMDAIHYKTSGNKVPKSEGAVPLMNLPDEFPVDLDYKWYVAEAKRILQDIGYKFRK